MMSVHARKRARPAGGPPNLAPAAREGSLREGARSLADRDPPGLSSRTSRQRQSEHPILELGANVLPVDLVGEREGSRVMPDVVLGVDGFQPGVPRRVEAPLDAQDALF